MSGAAKVHGDIDSMPVSDIFLALGAELERMRTLGLRVEVALCAMAVRTQVDSTIVRELQQLDAVLQQLGALRDFTTVLAQSGGAGRVAVANALDRIALSDVRARLSGREILDPEQDDGWEVL